jgi:hypothetical protein
LEESIKLSSPLAKSMDSSDESDGGDFRGFIDSNDDSLPILDPQDERDDASTSDSAFYSLQDIMEIIKQEPNIHDSDSTAAADDENLSAVPSSDAASVKKRRGRKRKHSEVEEAAVTSEKVIKYDIGELVFAQIKGFSPWPARVKFNKYKKFIYSQI